MPQYRYFTTGLLSGEVFAELPLYGVACSKVLNGAGNFTGTFKLGTNVEPDDILLSSTAPRKTSLYVQRDGTTIWGGIIWSRTYGTDAHTVQLNGQTFESYLERYRIRSLFNKVNTNQLIIARDLFLLLQGNVRSDIGIDLSEIVTTGGTSKSILVPPYDNKFLFEVLDELASSEDGFDWTIRVRDTGIADQPEKVLQLGQPIITSPSQTGAYSYPGTIAEFYWPESGGDSGTDFLILGAGSGSNMLTASAVWPGALVDDEYPILDKIISWKNVSNATQLSSIAQNTADVLGQDSTNPTLTIVSDREPQFDGWDNLGANVFLELGGPRFPNQPLETVRRMIGWDLSVGGSGQNETVKIRLEGGEAE
jgi:hypothetical protein